MGGELPFWGPNSQNVLQFYEEGVTAKTGQGSFAYFHCDNKGCDPTQAMALKLETPNKVPTKYEANFQVQIPYKKNSGSMKLVFWGSDQDHYPYDFSVSTPVYGRLTCFKGLLTRDLFRQRSSFSWPSTQSSIRPSSLWQAPSATAPAQSASRTQTARQATVNATLQKSHRLLATRAGITVATATRTVQVHIA